MAPLNSRQWKRTDFKYQAMFFGGESQMFFRKPSYFRIASPVTADNFQNGSLGSRLGEPFGKGDSKMAARPSKKH
jgi:hypothetical protein